MASTKMEMGFESHIREVVKMEVERARKQLTEIMASGIELARKQLTEIMASGIEQTMKHVTERILGLVNLSGTSLNFPVKTSQGTDYQLQFANDLPDPIFTDSEIEAKIQLVGPNSKAIVTSGPLSSMNIKIVVLDGDLGFDNQGNWTQQEFNAKVVREKKDKRPLVIGDLVIALRDGVGTFNDLKFTDNSSWIKCGQFRLSARAVSGEVTIKEAISNAFKVKEYRGKASEKHHPPSLDDKVWRLVGIGKDGKRHKKLAADGIETVRDFKQMYEHEDNTEQLKICFPSKKKKNTEQLKQTLHCTDRQWDKIVKHASEAVDDQNYQPSAKRCRFQKPSVENQNDRAHDLTSLHAEPISTPTTGLPSDPTCGDHNTSMEGLQATCNETTVTNLDCGMTSQDPMSTCFPVSASLSSCIQEPLVESQNNWAHDLTSLQAEPISTPTTGLSSDPTCGDHNTGMEGLQATCSETTVTNLDCGMTSQDPMSTCFPVSASLSSCIQESLVESQNDWAYDLTSLQAEPISTPTTGLSSDRTCGDHKTGMEVLQATCNETTVTNLDCGMTSQDPMSTSPSVGVQFSDSICGETVPSLAYGMTSQAPTSTTPVTALWEHNNGSCLPLITSGSEAQLIGYPFDATSDLNFFYSQIRSPGNEELGTPFFPHYQEHRL